MSDRHGWFTVSIACLSLLAAACSNDTENAKAGSASTVTTEQHAVADPTTSGFASSAEYEAALERAGDRDRFFDTTVQVQLAIESTDVDARCSWAPRSSSRDLLRPITELPDEVVQERAVLWIEDYLEVQEMCLAGFPEGAFAQHKQTSDEFDDIVDLIEERAAEASE